MDIHITAFILLNLSLNYIFAANRNIRLNGNEKYEWIQGKEISEKDRSGKDNYRNLPTMFHAIKKKIMKQADGSPLAIIEFKNDPIHKGLWGKRVINLQNAMTMKSDYINSRHSNGPIEKGLWGKRGGVHQSTKLLKDFDDGYVDGVLNKGLWGKRDFIDQSTEILNNDYAGVNNYVSPLHKGLWGKREKRVRKFKGQVNNRDKKEEQSGSTKERSWDKKSKIHHQNSRKINARFADHRHWNGPIEKGLWGKWSIKDQKNRSLKDYSNGYVSGSTVNNLKSVRTVTNQGTKMLVDRQADGRYDINAIPKGLWGKKEMMLQNARFLKDVYDENLYQNVPIEKGLWGRRNIILTNINRVESNDNGRRNENNPFYKIMLGNRKVIRDTQAMEKDEISGKYDNNSIYKGLWGKRNVKSKDEKPLTIYKGDERYENDPNFKGLWGKRSHGNKFESAQGSFIEYTEDSGRKRSQNIDILTRRFRKDAARSIDNVYARNGDELEDNIIKRKRMTDAGPV